MRSIYSICLLIWIISVFASGFLYHTFYQRRRRCVVDHFAVNPPAPAEGENNDEVNLQVMLQNQDVELSEYEETLMDQSIKKAVKQVMDQGTGTQAPPPSPLEKFNMLMSERSQKGKEGSTNSTKLDAAQMLQAIFNEKQTKEPFDEKKVMIKLRRMLHQDDFNGLFNDPSVGDWL